MIDNNPDNNSQISDFFNNTEINISQNNNSLINESQNVIVANKSLNGVKNISFNTTIENSEAVVIEDHDNSNNSVVNITDNSDENNKIIDLIVEDVKINSVGLKTFDSICLEACNLRDLSGAVLRITLDGKVNFTLTSIEYTLEEKDIEKLHDIDDIVMSVENGMEKISFNDYMSFSGEVYYDVTSDFEHWNLDGNEL